VVGAGVLTTGFGVATAVMVGCGAGFAMRMIGTGTVGTSGFTISGFTGAISCGGGGVGVRSTTVSSCFTAVTTCEATPVINMAIRPSSIAPAAAKAAKRLEVFVSRVCAIAIGRNIVVSFPPPFRGYPVTMRPPVQVTGPYQCSDEGGGIQDGVNQPPVVLNNSL
jgi:hypothetical protein